ncbi:hypothetical protein AB1N83_013760 [Pleurotus pulmonarius]
MLWATPEQLEYMSTKALAYHATMKGSPERREFNAELREGWSERWPLLEQHTKMFSSYFRDELGRRGLIPKRKRKPTPKKPKTPKAAPSNPPDPPARAPLASTSRHQDTRSLTPISRSHSPIASTSRLQDPASLEELTPRASTSGHQDARSLRPISRSHSPIASTSRLQDPASLEEGTPRASTSGHQDTRSLRPISRSHSPIASTSRLPAPAPLEELISATRSPVPSTSFQQDARPIEELVLGLFVTPRATPPARSTSGPPCSRSSTLSVQRLLLDNIDSSPPPEGREREGNGMAAVLDQHVQQRDATRSLRFQLDMPGIEHDDVRLFVQNQRLAVCAHTSNVSYEWEMGLGGNVLPDHVHGGMVSGNLRLDIAVDETDRVDSDIWVFSVANEWPW